MCIAPVKIRNPKRNFDIMNDKVFLEVPCGHCVECIEQKIMSWQNRLYFDWLYLQKNGGCSYFLTLTYAPKYVPKFYPVHYLYNFATSYKIHSIALRHKKSLIFYNNQSTLSLPFRNKPINSFLCFSRRDLQLFFKRVRYYLKEFNLDNSFRYFVASEYGKNGTCRPHYHIVLFFEKYIDGKTLRSLLELSWSNVCPDGNREPIGWICLGGKGRLDKPIDHRSALSYTAKYIAKDSFSFDKVLELRRQGFTLKDVSNFNPFILSSKGLGLHLFDMPSCYNKEFGLMQVPHGNELRNIPMNLYYIRKLYYDVRYLHRDKYYINKQHKDDSPCYIINDCGIRRNLNIYSVRKQSFVNYWLAVTAPSSPYFNNPVVHRFNDLLTSQNSSVGTILSDLFDFRLVFHGRNLIYRLVIEKDNPFFADFDEDFMLSEPYYAYQLCYSKLETSPFIYQYDWLDELQHLVQLSNLLSECQQVIKYNNYVKKVDKWNTIQSYRTFITGEYKHHKPRPKLTFNQFVASATHYKNFIHYEPSKFNYKKY